jgi:hypothetical protein
MKKIVRVYPTSCLSAYCGKTECPTDCPNLARLLEFKRWRDENKATRQDPVWCPNVWVAELPDTLAEALDGAPEDGVRFIERLR